jgi:hypothetical protein
MVVVWQRHYAQAHLLCPLSVDDGRMREVLLDVVEILRDLSRFLVVVLEHVGLQEGFSEALGSLQRLAAEVDQCRVELVEEREIGGGQRAFACLVDDGVQAV